MMCKVEYSTSTEGDTMTDTLLWTVPDFLDILSKESTRELRMQKPKDAAADWSGSRFNLKMRFLGRGNDTIEICYYSPIRLILKSEFKIRSKISGRKYYDDRVLDTKKNYINQGNQWQHLGALLKRDIVKDRDTFLINNDEDPKYGSICLLIKFTIHTNHDLFFINIEESKVAVTELIHDFGQLLTSGLYSDVTLKSVEGNEFKAHKAVLASRSVVLKSSFEHNTTECHTNIIESHFEAEVLKEVLMFIYTNKVMRVNEIPEKLLAAADFYQLSRLKSWCEEALSKKLTAENVIETLELADLYSAENLTQSTIELITHGQMRQIIETERWAKLNSELVKKIFKLYIMEDDIKNHYSTRDT